MIKSVREISDTLVEIESDNGGFLDIGGDVAKRFRLTRPEIEYVEELTPKKAEERRKYYERIGQEPESALPVFSEEETGT